MTWTKEDSKNKEGYPDPTVSETVKHISDEEERFNKLLGTIFYITKLAGFHLEGRIVLVDERTGRVWR